MMEKRGAGYRISARSSLDVPGFRSATWQTETLDADGDGYPELLFTGTGASGHPAGYRLLLYVPRTRQTYSVRFEADHHGGKQTRRIWSANAATPAAVTYRGVLVQHVRAAHAF
jgi:hypothetical protein